MLVNCVVYENGSKLADIPVADISEYLSVPGCFIWVALHDATKEELVELQDEFGLHPLAVEDAVHAHQRPKLERYDNTLFLVLKTVNYVEHVSVALAREIVETGEIMIFVGPDFVVTVRHGDHSGLAGVRKKFDASPTSLALGPYAVMHAIADHVVDSYLDVTDLIETDIDAMEEDIFSPTRKTNIECIYLLKREIVELRRAVAPLTLGLQRIGADHNDLISIEVRRYMRDVLDHNIQASDRITSYDEMLSSLVQAAAGKVAMQQNIDMRKISAYVAIAAVPTAIAGIYGMNFDNMPELHWAYGYPAVLLLMVIICGLLFRAFRRNHWL